MNNGTGAAGFSGILNLLGRCWKKGSSGMVAGSTSTEASNRLLGYRGRHTGLHGLPLLPGRLAHWCARSLLAWHCCAGHAMLRHALLCCAHHRPTSFLASCWRQAGCALKAARSFPNTWQCKARKQEGGGGRQVGWWASKADKGS